MKILTGVHIHHPIPVQRLKGTNKLNVPLPVCMALGRNREAIEGYNKIVAEVYEEMRKELGKKEKKLDEKKLKELSEFFVWLVNFGRRHGYKIVLTGIRNCSEDFANVLRKIIREHPDVFEVSEEV